MNVIEIVNKKSREKLEYLKIEEKSVGYYVSRIYKRLGYNRLTSAEESPQRLFHYS